MKQKPDQPTAAGPSEGSRRTPDSGVRGGTRWTPGPWENVRDDFIEAKSGTIVVLDGEVTAANAQLIAAAPELYEALEALAIATASADNPADQGVGSYGPEMDAARAALAKARGEQ